MFTKPSVSGQHKTKPERLTPNAFASKNKAMILRQDSQTIPNNAKFSRWFASCDGSISCAQARHRTPPSQQAQQAPRQAHHHPPPRPQRDAKTRRGERGEQPLARVRVQALRQLCCAACGGDEGLLPPPRPPQPLAPLPPLQRALPLAWELW